MTYVITVVFTFIEIAARAQLDIFSTFRKHTQIDLFLLKFFYLSKVSHYYFSTQDKDILI